MSGMNFATNTSFKLIINKFKDIEFTSQTSTIPGISLNFPDIQGPRIKTHMPPLSVNYELWNFSFLIKEDFSNHRALVQWMQDSTKKDVPNTFSDAKLLTLNSQRRKTSSLTFYDIMPIALGNIQYDTRDPNITYLTCTTTFRYLYFTYDE